MISYSKNLTNMIDFMIVKSINYRSDFTFNFIGIVKLVAVEFCWVLLLGFVGIILGRGKYE